MVRYIRPGNDALIKALTAAGVQLNLTAQVASDNANALAVQLYAKVGGGTQPGPVNATLIGGLNSLNVLAFGSLGSAFTQRGSTFDMDVQIRNAGVEIDPRSIRSLSITDTPQPVGSSGFPLTQDANSNLQTVLATPANVTYDARDTSDRAAREVGRVRPWGNADAFLLGAEQTAPSAGLTIVSAGGIAAGDYTLTLNAWASDTTVVGKRIVFVQQSSTGTDKFFLGGCAAPGQISIQITRLTLAASDKITARVGAAGAASSVYGATIQGKVAG